MGLHPPFAFMSDRSHTEVPPCFYEFSSSVTCSRNWGCCFSIPRKPRVEYPGAIYHVHLRAGLGGAVAAGNNADTHGDRSAAPHGQLEKLPCQVGSLEKSS